MCFAKTTKTKPFEKKKKATSLQKTENLSPLRKTFQSCGKSNTFFFEKKKHPLQKFKPLRFKKKTFQKKKTQAPVKKKRRKNGPH